MLLLPSAEDCLAQYELFLGALCAQATWEHVCCAVRPESVHGSQDTIIEAAVPGAAALTGTWAEQLAEAMSGVRSEADVLRVLDTVAFDQAELASFVEQQIVHGAMLGLLDSEWERENDDEIKPATFALEVVPTASFANVPFEQAIKLFEAKKLLPKAAFEALQDGAKRRAFTVAGLASEELLATAHAELLRQIKNSEAQTYKDQQTGKWVYQGPNFGEFKKHVSERLESAGWTPANPSHVETIYRTNIATAYQSGRFIETTRPAVRAALPYWQIKSVGDDRTRPTHKRANGIVLPANHPFWRLAYPPFGFSCRCNCIARTAAWVKRTGASIGPVPMGLPDPGFDSGTKALIQVPASAYEGEKFPAGQAPEAPARGPYVPPIPRVDPKLVPAQKPAPKPRKPVPPSRAASVMHEQVSGPRGSNPGGIYRGEDGIERYVKLYDDPGQAYSEHLANRLYSDLGLGKVKSLTFERGPSAVGYASELIPDVQTLRQAGLTPELAKQALDGFVGDVLTANWDAAGLDLDNLVVDKAGKVYRIDNGGTFLSRAQGARKPLAALNSISEFEKLFDPAVNPGYATLAQAAGVIGPADFLPQIKAGLKKAKAVAKKSGGWAAYVEQHGAGLTAQDKLTMSSMLDTRVRLIEEKVSALEAAAKAKAKRPPRPPVVFEALPRRDLTYTGLSPTTVDATGTVVDASPQAWKARAVERCAKLEPSQRTAISEFINEDYQALRDTLRLSREEWMQAHAEFMSPQAGAEFFDHCSKQAAHIVSSFDTAQQVDGRGLEQDVGEIFRGFKVPREVFDKILQAEYAETSTFTSFSWRRETADSFSLSGGTHNGITLIVKPRKGATSRLAIEGLSDLEEAEILVNRGARYRVTEVVRDANDERRAYIYLDELEEQAPIPTGADVAKLTIG